MGGIEATLTCLRWRWPRWTFGCERGIWWAEHRHGSAVHFVYERTAARLDRSLAAADLDYDPAVAAAGQP
jgi:hypothetical protein